MILKYSSGSRGLMDPPTHGEEILASVAPAHHTNSGTRNR